MTALRFEGLRSVHPRTEQLRAIVVHWTGGPDRGPGATRDALGVYETLRHTIGPHTPDGLSIHYVLEAEGLRVQMAGEELVCLHAGVANPFSIGIECVSPGKPDTAAAQAEARRGVMRRTYEDRIRGQLVRMLDFTEPQTSALVCLLEELCARHGIPRAIPREADGRFMAREMTAAELAGFRGVMGHFHCHDTKHDPGTAIFHTLAARWSA